MGVGAGLSMYVVIVQKFTFAISSPDEFLYTERTRQNNEKTRILVYAVFRERANKELLNIDF